MADKLTKEDSSSEDDEADYENVPNQIQMKAEKQEELSDSKRNNDVYYENVPSHIQSKSEKEIEEASKSLSPSLAMVNGDVTDGENDDCLETDGGGNGRKQFYHQDERSPIKHTGHDTKVTYEQRGISGNMNYSERVPNTYPQPTEAWPPVHPERPVTPNSQRRSVDETARRHPSQHRGNPLTAEQFVRGHRRGRSDEVCRGDSYHPTQYGSPPRFSQPSFRQIHPLHMSMSDNYLYVNSTNNRDNANRGQGNPPIHQSVSLDQSVLPQYVHDTLQRQNVSFINLSTSIRISEMKLRELEMGVEQREKELNKLLDTATNPTEKQYRQLKDDIAKLHGELTVMFDECDKLGIPTDSPIPPKPSMPTPSPTKPPSGGASSKAPTGPFSYPIHRPIDEVGTESLPPSYSNVNQPPPRYDTLDMYNRPSVTPSLFQPRNQQVAGENVSSQGCLLNPPSRPPRPPAVRPTNDMEDEGERWECPSCTFSNLLVVECEVCYTPRPSNNR